MNIPAEKSIFYKLHEKKYYQKFSHFVLTFIALGAILDLSSEF